jgi:hypothetical protein
VPADEPEVAVDVPDREPEEPAREPVIGAADDDAVERIGAPDLVAVDEVGPLALLPEEGQLADVVLGVAVGVEDEVLGRGAEAAREGAAGSR